MSDYSVAVVGPGAVGCFFGGHLAAVGREVTFCGRPGSVLPQVRVESRAAPVWVEAPRLRRAPAGGPVAWVLLATKCHQTAGAAEWLTRLCGPGTRVLVLQNGVEHHDRVGPLVGAATIVPGVVFCGVERVAPGELVHRSGGWVSVQEGPDGRAAAALFAGAGAGVRLEPDLNVVAWEKLCFNAAGGALLALTRRRNEVFGDAGIIALARTIAEEAARVGRAAGVALGGDVVDRVVARLEGLDPTGGSSLLFDQLAGRPLEWDARNGVVVRLAERYGVEVPASRVVSALLAASSGRSMGTSGG